jgi:hypothetical protein
MGLLKKPRADEGSSLVIIPSDGPRVGVLEGHKGPGCGGARIVEPPAVLRRGRRWYALRYWSVRFEPGEQPVSVFCFACGAAWQGRWEYVSLCRAGESEPNAGVSYLAPILTDPPILHGPHAENPQTEVIYRCTCSVGGLRRSYLPPAPPAVIQAAIDRMPPIIGDAI